MRSFLFGLGVGVGLGILFAPMRGDEARENLSDRANDLAHSAKEAYEHGCERVQRGVDQVCASANRAVSQFRTGSERVQY